MIRTSNIEFNNYHDYVKSRIKSMGQFSVLFLSGSPATIDGGSNKINYNTTIGSLGLGSPSGGPRLHVYGELKINGKIGFNGFNPTDQYTPQGANGYAAGGGSFHYETSSYNAGYGYAYTVGDIVTALKLIGILQM